jgi:hypothetical protein
MRVLLSLLFAARGAGAHGAGPAERKLRGGSFYVDGQFDGFASDGPVQQQLGGGAEQGDVLPAIRINSTAPLRAVSTCAGAPTYCCGNNGAWVEVSGRCSSRGAGVWWAGVFPASAPPDMRTIIPSDLPGNNTKSPWTPPFMVPAPLKFTNVHCDANLSKGSANLTWRQWWIPNTRQPVVLILFNGSSSNAHETARSQPIAFAEASAPMHVRLARTSLPTEMRVSWTSSCAESPQVQWGTSAAQLSRTASAHSRTYTGADVCGEPATTMGWWEPHWQHSAVLDLTEVAGAPSPGRVFYYKVSGCGSGSVLSSFRAPVVGHTTTLTAVLTADMGATTPDRISQHWAEADAYETTANMANLVDHGFAGRAVDLAFCVGDLSYATGVRYSQR